LASNPEGYSGERVITIAELTTSRHGWWLSKIERCSQSGEVAIQKRRFGVWLERQQLNNSTSAASAESLKKIDKLLCFLEKDSAQDLGVTITVPG
jgi:hypothetical protein